MWENDKIIKYFSENDVLQIIAGKIDFTQFFENPRSKLHF